MLRMKCKGEEWSNMVRNTLRIARKRLKIVEGIEVGGQDACGIERARLGAMPHQQGAHIALSGDQGSNTRELALRNGRTG